MTHNYRYSGYNSDDSEEDLLTYEGETDKEIIDRLETDIRQCRGDLERCEQSKLSNKAKKLFSCGRAGLKPTKKNKHKRKRKHTKKRKPTKKIKYTKKRKQNKKKKVSI